MFRLITSQPLAGHKFKLSEDNIENWDELNTVITDENVYQVMVVHDNKIHLGQLVRFTEGEDIRYAVSMDKSIMLPSGVCIRVDVEPVEEECTPCCNDTKLEVTKQTKLAVLDSDGCIAGFITIEDILGLVEKPTLCDLLPTAEERNGNLVAQDRILTISGKCNIKAVKQSDLNCK